MGLLIMLPIYRTACEDSGWTLHTCLFTERVIIEQSFNRKESKMCLFGVTFLTAKYM